MIRAINWLTLPLRILGLTIIVSLTLVTVVVATITPKKLNEVRK